MKRFTLILIILTAFVARSAFAQQEVSGVGIEQNLGNPLPLDATFKDHNGQSVTLGDYFKGDKPVVLNLVYYACPGLCTEVLNGVARSIDRTKLSLGSDYRVVTISFDPIETPELAHDKRENYLNTLTNRSGEESWVFLTGTHEQIDRVTDAVGFNYFFNEESKLFVHDEAAIICTIEGMISRYLSWTDQDEQTYRLSLVEASDGKIGSFSDRAWVQICGYDPSLGKYVVMAKTIVTIGGACTLALVAGVMGYMFYRENKRKRGMQPHAA
jgi:protein SCO1/2